MPTYDYICTDCGAFESYASMADFDKPQPCPFCAAPARSADSPRRSAHAPGCSCCSGGATKKKNTGTFYRPDGSKSFPAKRPWMISH